MNSLSSRPLLGRALAYTPTHAFGLQQALLLLWPVIRGEGKTTSLRVNNQGAASQEEISAKYFHLPPILHCMASHISRPCCMKETLLTEVKFSLPEDELELISNLRAVFKRRRRKDSET